MKPNILIIGPAWVGDMVMAQCLFKLLKIRYPDATIDVLAPAWSLPLLERMPEITNAITLPFQHGEFNILGRLRLARTLRHYSHAIVLPNSWKSALIPWLAGIPIRTGWRGEMRYFLLNDLRILDKARYPLMIERFMALGLNKNESLSAPYPHPELHISIKTQADALITHQLTAPKKLLALCPGAEFGPAKRWPEEYFAEVANAALAEGFTVWIFGSKNDKAISETIRLKTENRAVNLAGSTTLAEAIDLLALSTVVISNDSGLMHIAAALKKPLIALFGPTSKTFTPPLHENATVLSLSLPCQPCFERICPLQHGRCMQDLKPDHVLKTLKELVA